LRPVFAAVSDLLSPQSADLGTVLESGTTGVHLVVLEKALDGRGITDKVEVHLFNEPMHPNTALIDTDLVIVGSQNYHYSAFGDGSGLAEYSMGVDDPQAVIDFQPLFDYQWECAEPVN